MLLFPVCQCASVVAGGEGLMLREPKSRYVNGAELVICLRVHVRLRFGLLRTGDCVIRCARVVETNVSPGLTAGCVQRALRRY